jgi:ABC-type uncharacterized transport system involved in gliding motility auxiliary subunit
MKKQHYQTTLYSMIGVVAMAAILIGFNVIAASFKVRLDLTQQKEYTLSPGTRAILKKLDTPVKIRFYSSQGETTSDTMFLRNYAKDVEALLDEYKQAAGGKIVIEKLDPQPDSDAEDAAQTDGMEPRLLRNGDQAYLGLSIGLLDQKETIPFLDPSEERLLEYRISRAISRVVTPEKPVVGVMSPLPVFGMPSNPMMMRMGQQGQQPWALITELQNDFDVRPVSMDVERIDEAIKVLVLIHPKGISNKSQFAIDQFVLRGGKLLAFLDPVAALADPGQQNEMFGSLPNPGSNLEKLLKAWGLSFDTGKVVADLNFKMQIGDERGRPQEAPAALSVTTKGLNADDVITSQIDNIWMAFSGAFTGTPAQGLNETVLVRSTKDSELVEGFMARLSGENVMKDFKPSNIEYALAVKLNGRFKTAFPEGMPTGGKDTGSITNGATALQAGDFLKESKEESTVVLVGDVDMIHEKVALQPVRTLFGTVLAPANGNLSFAQNAIEQLAGDNNLITVRSRATLTRPFTRIQEMLAVANQKYQAEMSKLEQKKGEATRRLGELQQQKKDKDQRFILSPEQAQEIRNLRKEEAETSKKLKQVRKEFQGEIVALQDTLKWLNILAVPLAVAVSGILIAAVKRKKTSAK